MKFGELNNEKRIYDSKFIEPVKFLPVCFRTVKKQVNGRSLYIAQHMQSGDILTPDNLRAIRPGQGLPPKYYNLLLGKKIKADVQAGTPVKWELLM
jgi:sialic acid synthase SpsE